MMAVPDFIYNWETGRWFDPDDKNIKKIDDYWVIDDYIKTKNIILATGYEEIIDIPYIKIRPVWGERIEIKADFEDNEICSLKKCYFHKNCSIGEIDGIIKIGATHKRNCLECRENEEEARELIEKAKEKILKEFGIILEEEIILVPLRKR